MKLKMLVAVLVMALSFGGCAAKLNHPNAINQFDDKAYDTLLAAQAAIEDAKAHVGEHPEAKDVLNEAIAAYDTAMPAYKAYHATGASDPNAGAQLQEALSGLAGAIAQLEQAFGRKLGGK